MSDSSQAVFLSYASQDAEAAARVAEALRAAGVEVWFDKSELVGGDAWDQKIRRQIKECALFVPIISTQTQARPEGYFRLEWKLAVDRSFLMADDQPFLFPVVIDETSDAQARVPDRFRERQWMRLDTSIPEKIAQRLVAALTGDEAAEKPAAPAVPSSSLSQPVRRLAKTSLRPWFIAALVGVLAVVTLAIWQPWKSSDNGLAGPGAPHPASSPARQLVDRAEEMIARPNPPRETLESAWVLIEQAKLLDPSDAEAWAVGALTDAWVIFYTYDTDEALKHRAQSDSARALSLDPNSYNARLARAFVLTVVVAQASVRPEAEALLRGLIEEQPDDNRAVEFLALLLRDAGRLVEAADLFKRANSFNSAGWTYFLAHRIDEAASVVDEALLTEKSVASLLLKSYVEAYGREDLDAAQATIDQLPASALLEDHTCSSVVQLHDMRREPEKMLELLRAIPRDWLSSINYVGPKAAWTGDAHAMANRHQAAEADWRAALQLVEQRLATDGNAPRLILTKAELLANLGDLVQAEELLNLERQLSGSAAVGLNQSLQRSRISVLVGRRDDVLNWLETVLRDPAGDVFVHALARFDASYDPFRGDPRFEKLLRETLPKGAKPFDDQIDSLATSH